MAAGVLLLPPPGEVVLLASGGPQGGAPFGEVSAVSKKEERVWWRDDHN